MRLLKFWFPVLLYSAIIFGVSAVPNLKTPYEAVNSDKVAHILLYMPFGFLMARAVRGSQPEISKRMLLLAVVVFTMTYGISDEIHQVYVPGRAAGLDDTLADTIGGLLGGLIYTLWRA